MASTTASLPTVVTLSPTKSKKKRAKKRKATLPIGGEFHKKVIESVSSTSSRSNSDDELLTDKDDEWESELMLKDSKWSMSKGVKKPSINNLLTTTPIILRHENANKKVNNREIPILDLTDGEIDNFDELMDISVNRIVNKL